MKLFMTFLKDRLGTVLLFLFMLLIFLTVPALAGTDMEWILYSALLCFFTGLIDLLWKFYCYRLRHRALVSAANSPDLLPERLPEPANLIETDYNGLVQAQSRRKQQLEHQIGDKHQEDTDYYTLWVHQIKTPIAALRLLMEDPEPDRIQMKLELFRIEDYTEMVLQYLRLGSPATDYRFESVNLNDIVRAAVRKYAPLFIRKKIAVELGTLDCVVMSDRKWLSFVVEQLLSNALKYTKQGKISIFTDGDSLIIRDTGIGILPEDLPRVFDRGYTGWNGRMDKKASGLGLYLCRRITANLALKLHLESVPGQGTDAVISFPDKPDVRD